MSLQVADDFKLLRSAKYYNYKKHNSLSPIDNMLSLGLFPFFNSYIMVQIHFFNSQAQVLSVK